VKNRIHSGKKQILAAIRQILGSQKLNSPVERLADENGPGEGPRSRQLQEKKQVRIFSLMKRLR